MKLEAVNLGATLRGRLVLSGVDLVAPPGEVTAIIGPNGAGKSTLLRTLAGLLAPVQGHVTLDGMPLAQWSRQRLARVLAYVPQDRTVHWALTCRAVVALGRLPYQARGAGESAADARAIAEALDVMDVAHLQDRPVTDVSGGELARVLVARALAQEPSVLIADEPAAGLDPAHQLALFRCFTAIAASGRSVVVALHDLSLAARFCHSAILMQAGRVVASGAPANVLTPANLAAAYRVSAGLHMLDGIPVVQVRDELP